MYENNYKIKEKHSISFVTEMHLRSEFDLFSLFLEENIFK